MTANKHYDKSTFFDNLDKNILKDIIIKQIIEINGNTNLIRSKKISINIPASLLLDIEYLNKIVTLSSFILAIEVTNMDINHDSFNILKKHMKHILKTSSTEFWLDDFSSNRYDIEIVRAFPWNIIKLDKSIFNSHDYFHENINICKEIQKTKHFELIVEGVENKEKQKLANKYSTFSQGYLYGRPKKTSHYLNLIASA
ncbi:hypothetical protein C0W29_15685 [Photobacterium kishitanii]|nr:hypothetical protein C0W29_15685 [Photobacterium kishitanii]